MKILKKKEIKKFFKEYKRKKEIVLILEDLQYAKNVATIFRTADAAGVKKIIITGITTTPPFGKDLRKASRNKEKSVFWQYAKSTGKEIQKLKKEGYFILGLELTDTAVEISKLKDLLKDKDKICLIPGNEVHGIKRSTLEHVDQSTFIPMYGKGASLNVSVSVGVALFSF